MAIRIERNKKREIDTSHDVSGNINPKDKVGLLFDSRGLDRSRITKYDNAALVYNTLNRCLYLCYDDSSRFFCFDKGRLAPYGGIKGQSVLIIALSSFSLHTLTFSVKVVQFYRKFYRSFRFDSRTSRKRAFDIIICIANLY